MNCTVKRILQNTITEAAKTYSNAVSNYYTKTQPKICEIGTNALKSLTENVTDIVSSKNRIRQIREEAEREKELQAKRARKITFIVGGIALAAGIAGGYGVAKGSSIQQSDYVFHDVQAKPIAFNRKEYTDTCNGYKLSSDGTTLLMRL